jgi:hypothetical protein
MFRLDHFDHICLPGHSARRRGMKCCSTSPGFLGGGASLSERRGRSRPGSTLAIRSSGAGAVLTDRDQVDDVPGHASASAATLVPSEKRGWPSPRRQQPVYQGPDASCRAPPPLPVRDRASPRQSSGTAACEIRPRAKEATRRPVTDRPSPVGRQGSLAEPLLPARGRPSAFFQGGYPHHATDGCHVRIHLIAIRKSPPWPDGRAPAEVRRSTDPPDRDP